MFDPYRKWLGIPEQFRPPTHYQLLGIGPDEHDRDVIEAAAIRQSAYVRNFQSGPQGDDASRLLTEIAAARGCLLDKEKRAAYDAALRRQAPAMAQPMAGVPRAMAVPVTPIGQLPPSPSFSGLTTPFATQPASQTAVPLSAGPQSTGRAAPVSGNLHTVGGRPAPTPSPGTIRVEPSAGQVSAGYPRPQAPATQPAVPPTQMPADNRPRASADALIDQLLAAQLTAPPLRKRTAQTPLPRPVLLGGVAACGVALGFVLLIAGLRAISERPDAATSTKPTTLAAKPPANAAGKSARRPGPAPQRPRTTSIARPGAADSASRAGNTPALPMVPPEPVVPSPPNRQPGGPGSGIPAPGAENTNLPTGADPAGLISGAGQPNPQSYPPGNRPAPPGGDRNANGQGLTNGAMPPAQVVPNTNPFGLFQPEVKLSEDRPLAEIRRLVLGGAFCTTLLFSHSGKQLAAGLSDGRVVLWSTETPTEYKTIDRFYSPGVPVTCLAFSSNDDMLLVALNNGPIHCIVANRPGFPEVIAFFQHTKAVRRVVFVNAGSVASSGDDGTVRFWSLLDGRQTATFGGFTQGINCLWVADDGSRFVASDSLRVGIAKLDSSKPPKNIKISPVPTSRVSLSHDGRYLACPDGKGLNVRDLSNKSAPPFPDDKTRQMGEARFSPDDQLLATSNQSDATVTLWDFEHRLKLASLAGHSAVLSDIAFSPGNQLLATASLDTTVRVWRLADLETMREDAAASAKSESGKSD